MTAGLAGFRTRTISGCGSDGATQGAQPQLSLQLFRCRAGLSLGVASVLTLREHPVSAREMTGVSARPLLQIILVLRLGFPEVTHGLDFCDDLTVP